MTAETIIRALTATFPEKVRQMHADLARGYDVTPSPSFLRELAEAHLDEPARLAAARAEGHAAGYREGVEAANSAVRRTIPHPGGSSCGLTWDEALAALDALAPAPAEAPTTPTVEATDWTVSDTELARDILSYLGIGSDASLEPGDRRRDRIAAMICADRERRIVRPAEASAPVAEGRMERAKSVQEAGIRRYLKKRIDTLEQDKAALEAEVAALRKRSALVVQALDGPGANAQLLVSAVDGLRALLQGQGGADGR